MCGRAVREQGWEMPLGERILVLGHRLKLSQSTLAEATGITKNTIARVERGEMRELSSTRIVRPG